jgi:hypothetical protein
MHIIRPIAQLLVQFCIVFTLSTIIIDVSVLLFHETPFWFQFKYIWSALIALGSFGVSYSQSRKLQSA